MKDPHAPEDGSALFDEAADHLGLDPEAREILRYPMREHRGTVPVRMNDGSFRLFHVHRVQHNHALGPTIGGFRWHPTLGAGASREIAAWNTWQAAMAGLPHGGASGGVDCNPKELSTGEKERLARGAARLLAGLGGADHDVMIPDLYTTPQIMGWMMDAHEHALRPGRTSIVAGRPAVLGGIPGLSDAVARSGVVAVGEAARDLDLDPAKLRFAVQGFGNLGRAAAARHVDILGGGKLVGVSDSRGAAIGPRGIDPARARSHKLQTGHVEGTPGTEPAPGDALFGVEADVLYAAAPPGLVTASFARRLGARIFCELGRAPAEPEADAEFAERETLLVPGMLGSAGRIIAAHLELVQDLSNDRWPAADVADRIGERTRTAYHAVREMAGAEGVSMRVAAWMVGISRVAEACRARGWC